jgi:hypothetical protein
MKACFSRVECAVLTRPRFWWLRCSLRFKMCLGIAVGMEQCLGLSLGNAGLQAIGPAREYYGTMLLICKLLAHLTCTAHLLFYKLLQR